MKLSIRGLGLSGAIVWGACVFFVGLGGLIWSGYGEAFLEVVRSLYPGYAKISGFWGVIVGTLYALLDGFIAGAVFAWIYNFFAADRAETVQEAPPATQY